MRKQLIVWWMIVIVLFATSASAGAQDNGSLIPLEPPPALEMGEVVVETPRLWFVELAGRPIADGGHPETIQREHANFRAEAGRAGLQYVERYAFDTLWNGLSVEIPHSEVAKLWRIPGVKNLYPVLTIPAPEPQPIGEPFLSTALAMTGADIAQSELGLTGAGIRVGVIDSGIDYTHPDLGGDPDGPRKFPTERVVAGYDFVGDDFVMSDPNNTPQPNPDPMDCSGHGTIVAGVIGADAADEDGVTGVAPGVTFGAYKIYGCVHTGFPEDVLIKALEMALADEMDVVNASFGIDTAFPQAPLARAVDRLVNQGVVVVAAMGNSGQQGLYTGAAPAVGNKVIGVAAVENTHIDAPTFHVHPDESQVPYLPMGVTPHPPTSGETPEVVFVGRGCVFTLGDTYLEAPEGKVALIERGDCTFQEKYQAAADAGAVGVVIYNNLPGFFVGGGVTPRADVFGVTISREDGLHIRSLLEGGVTVTLAWSDESAVAPYPLGGTISPFSSYGPAPDLSLKPDISAPGGLIRTTAPVAQGSYATASGTSLSAPYVSGAAALLLEARPNTPSQAVRGILQNSAAPMPWWGNPDLGLDNVHRQGAGLLNIAQAIMATTKIEPAKLSLGASDAGPATRTLWIENNGPNAVTYSLSHVPALATDGNTFAPSISTGFASVDFSSPSVTVPSGATASVDVTITANPAIPERGLYGGYIVFDADDGQVYRVPYAGFKGDYQSIVVLEPRDFGFPWLARVVEVDGELFLQNVQTHPEGATFNLVGLEDFPVILFHLAHPARRLRAEVFDADTGRAWHRAFEFEYFFRNATPIEILPILWDGVTTNGRRVHVLPDGDYVLRLSVQKALGEDDNPDHWETWTSPVITLARPDAAGPPANVGAIGRAYRFDQTLYMPALEVQALE